MFTKASGSPSGAVSEVFASEAVEKVWMEEWYRVGNNLIKGKLYITLQSMTQHLYNKVKSSHL